MVSMTPSQSTSVWQRFLTHLHAVAEAADMDGFTYQEHRIIILERRIATLEAASLSSARAPISGGN